MSMFNELPAKMTIRDLFRSTYALSCEGKARIEELLDKYEKVYDRKLELARLRGEIVKAQTLYDTALEAIAKAERELDIPLTHRELEKVAPGAYTKLRDYAGATSDKLENRVKYAG